MSQKQKKRAIIIGVILLVLLVSGITGSVLLRTSQPLFTKLTIAMMPDSLDYKDSDGNTITFYVEENKDYDKEKDEPLDAYKAYYYKDKDKKERVDLDGGVYMTDKEYAESKRSDKKDTEQSGDARYNVGEGTLVTVGFLAEAQKKANVVKKVVNVLLGIFIVCVIAYLIYLWYLNWSKRYDKKAQKLAEAEEILNKNNEE